MFSDGSLRRTTSQQRIEPASKRYPGIAARGSSLKDHGQADDNDDDSGRNPRKANSAWGNQMIGKQGNSKKKNDSCDEDVYSYIQEAYNKTQRTSGSKQQGSQEQKASLAGGYSGMDIHNYCENGMIPKEKEGGNFTKNMIENNSLMGSQWHHGNSISCDKSSESSKQHRVSRLDEYRQALKEQEYQNQDVSCLRSQDNSKEKHQGSSQLSEWGQQHQQQRSHKAQDEKIKELSGQEQAQKNAISQYQSNNYQSVYNRDDFRLTEVMDMEKQIERLKILFEFFDIWDTGLVKREEQEHERGREKESQNDDSQLARKLQGSDTSQNNKDLAHFDALEELMSKMRVLSEREDQLDAFEKDLQQLRIESDAKGELIKKEMLQIEEDMELFFDGDGESDSTKGGNIRHSHEHVSYANGIAASLDNRFASLRNKEEQVAEGEKEQCNIWEQLQQSRAGMEQHLKQLTVMEEQLSSEKAQLSQQLKEELSRLELLRVQANCVMNAQSSEQYMKKLQMRDAQLAIAEDKAAQRENVLMNQIRAAKGQQQQQRLGQEQQQQQYTNWQQQKQNSLHQQNQNVHSQQPPFGQQIPYQHQNSTLLEQLPQQFETLNEKNAGGQPFQLASQQTSQQQQHQKYQQQQQQQHRQSLLAYQQQPVSRFSNSSREITHNNENHLPPRDKQLDNNSHNRSCYEASPNYQELPALPITPSHTPSQQGGRGSGGVRMQDKILQQMILNQQQKHQQQQQQQQGNQHQNMMQGAPQNRINTKLQFEERQDKQPYQMYAQEMNYQHSKSQPQIPQEQYLNQNSRIPSSQQKYTHSSSSSTTIPSSDKTVKSTFSQNHEWEKYPARITPPNCKPNNENTYPMPPLQRQLRFP